jgi:site-specific DNA-methyltransferase (adenine-specific)
MVELPDDCISLVVTSPPYWNAIDYKAHCDSDEAWYRNPSEEIGFNDYMREMAVAFHQVYRVIKPGGYVAIVVGTILNKGDHIPLPARFTVMMENIGFQFQEDITWYKCTAGTKRARVMIQHPYPGYFYPNLMTEHILIFKKRGPSIYKGRVNSHEDEIELSDLWKKEIANSIWHIAPVPPNTVDHPTPFPDDIPLRLILLYSYPGDAVLDPFIGSGTVAYVAKSLRRKYVGYDTQEEYVRLARERTDSDTVGAARRQIKCEFSHFTADEEGSFWRRNGGTDES